MRQRNFIYTMIFLLIGSVFLSGIPGFVSEDANGDRRIDLKDAVANAQRLDSGAFDQAEYNCASTMQAVAGIKNISPGSFETDDFAFLSLCFMISITDFPHSWSCFEIISDSDIFFNSIEKSPPYLPPILV